MAERVRFWWATSKTGMATRHHPPILWAPPVPEPSTWVTMATGFAALGLAGLRRRRKA